MSFVGEAPSPWRHAPA